MRAAVITVSDRSASGLRDDRSGPAAVSRFREAGFDCADALIVPDGVESVRQALTDAVASGARVIVTSGGTGIAPRDLTPEGTAKVLETVLPGVAEELRRRGAKTPGGLLSRGIAGIARGALIVNLPGSPGGVADGMDVVLTVAAHTIEQLDGHDHS